VEGRAPAVAGTFFRSAQVLCCSLFPSAFLVFRVTQNAQNEDPLGLIVHSCNQPVLVASNVENRSLSDQIGVAVYLTHFHPRFPIRFANDRVPGFEASLSLRIRMVLPKLHRRASLYDAHAWQGSHSQHSLIVSSRFE